MPYSQINWIRLPLSEYHKLWYIADILWYTAVYRRAPELVEISCTSIYYSLTQNKKKAIKRMMLLISLHFSWLYFCQSAISLSSKNKNRRWKHISIFIRLSNVQYGERGTRNETRKEWRRWEIASAQRIILQIILKFPRKLSSKMYYDIVRNKLPEILRMKKKRNISQVRTKKKICDQYFVIYLCAFSRLFEELMGTIPVYAI